MNIDATFYYGPITTTSNDYTISNTSNYSHNLYEDFLATCKVKMNHLPSDIIFVRRVFPGYLTDEELQERQFEGRFWDVIGPDLFILVDNETLVVADKYRGDVKILGRDKLPYSLQGRYYDEY